MDLETALANARYQSLSLTSMDLEAAKKRLVYCLQLQVGSFERSFHALEAEGRLHDQYVSFVNRNMNQLNLILTHDRDELFDVDGLSTLIEKYLSRSGNKVVETPQQMFLRVAIFTSGYDITKVRMIYESLSQHHMIFSSPTLKNAGMKQPQVHSCFLPSIESDSLSEVYDVVHLSAMISKNSGGVGINGSKVRPRGSGIKSTGGISSGLIPIMRVFNSVANHVDQGGGFRKGAFCFYVEPWHGDIFEFLDSRSNRGNENLRARDLFTGLMIPDLFMKRAIEDDTWSLFGDPYSYKLNDLWGTEFEQYYCRLEEEGKQTAVVNAKDLFKRIIRAVTETGTPFILFKDTINRYSNQSNLGTIKSSNLCAEVLQYSDENTTGVTCLASINLTACVDRKKGTFCFDQLECSVYMAVLGLNNELDFAWYPDLSTRRSAVDQRSIGVGIQGLADVMFLLDHTIESDEFKALNRKISEHIYYFALKASCELAKLSGPYKRYVDSKIDQGILQPDYYPEVILDKSLKWDELRDEIKRYGVRNSLMIAYMPTATTSIILGNYDAFDFPISNIYKRSTASGEYLVFNKYLKKELVEQGLLTPQLLRQLVLDEGSVINLEISEHLKSKYKTVFEVEQKMLIDLAADRQPFVCHSQSLSLYFEEPTMTSIGNLVKYAWEKGLKTGLYYLRGRSTGKAIKYFTAPNQNIF